MMTCDCYCSDPRCQSAKQSIRFAEYRLSVVKENGQDTRAAENSLTKAIEEYQTVHIRSMNEGIKRRNQHLERAA